MYERLQYDKKVQEIALIDKKNPSMLLDILLYDMENEVLEIYEADKEVAVLLLEGEIELEYEGKVVRGKRSNVFDDMPFCLHICAGVKLSCKVNAKAKFIVQKTINHKEFASKLFTPEDLDEVRAGEGFMENTSTRLIRTIFDYSSAPYSNMVLGEVITDQGRWSSYPPHTHAQPEVYYYKFDKEQGFGCAMVGDKAYKVEDNSYIAIDGGLTHPQSTAPGYRMYFCWMIRHLDGNPWTERIFEEKHEWMLR